MCLSKSPFSKHHNNSLQLNTTGLLSEKKLSEPSKKQQLSWHCHSVSTKLSNLYAKLFPHLELRHPVLSLRHCPSTAGFCFGPFCKAPGRDVRDGVFKSWVCLLDLTLQVCIAASLYCMVYSLR